MTAAMRLAQIVATYYGTNLGAMLRKRRPESVWLRAVAIQAMVRYPHIGVNEMGRALDLDHSTVIYLRGLGAVRGRVVELEPDLLRLIAIGVEARSRVGACPHCGGTGKVVA